MRLFPWVIASSIALAGPAAAQEIDTSKPTNFYSSIDNTFEYTDGQRANVYGYRGNLTMALSAKHLLLAEIPLLFNDRTEKFGLGDIRARYFFLPYKNYDNLLGAFGPSVDVFAPTGSFEDGLGSSSWVVSPGVTIGIMAADWIQFFPILSYQYTSEPTADGFPPERKKALHGGTFQVLVPVVFSPEFFMQFTPIYAVGDFANPTSDGFTQEILAAYTLSPKIQVTGFFRRNFDDEVNTFRGGVTLFF